MISLIAAIGENGELGAGNDLIFHIKEDMKYFKETTLGHPILMGKNTLLSIGNKPLPGRENFVITHHPEELPAGVTPVTDLVKFLEAHQHTPEEIFVIGGATVYKQALPYATHLYLTEVHASRPAGVFFPTFDQNLYAKQIIKEGKDDDLTYSFVKYIKK